MTVRPSRVRSVVMEPEPKGRVWLDEPSDRWVSVPDPNFCVVPVRGCVAPARGGVGSTADATGRPATRHTSIHDETTNALVRGQAGDLMATGSGG